MGRCKNIDTKILKKLIPTLMDDIEEFNTLVEKITTEVVEIKRKPELERDEDGTELLQFHDNT